MTQVKEWSNQELNRKLAELMGWTEGGHPITGELVWWKDKNHLTLGNLWNPCNDPIASLEVQTAAIRVNAKKYFNHLERQMHPGLEELPESETWSAFGVSELFNAKPRERAEAAYITMQGVHAHVD